MALPSFSNIDLTDTFGSWKDKTNLLAADVESLHALNVNLEGSQTIAGSKTFSSTVVLPSTGLTIGGDVNLYRQSANLLKTDDGLQSSSLVTGTLSAGAITGSSTLNITGATVLSSISGTSLSVSGSTSLGSVSANSATISSLRVGAPGSAVDAGVVECTLLISSSGLDSPTGLLTIQQVEATTVNVGAVNADDVNSVGVTVQDLVVTESFDLGAPLQSGYSARFGGGVGAPLNTVDIRSGGIRFADGTTQTTAPTTGIFFVEPSTITITAANNAWGLYSLTAAGVPSNAKAVIIQQIQGTVGGGSGVFCDIDFSSTLAASIIYLGLRASEYRASMQGVYPLDTNSIAIRRNRSGSQTPTIQVIGYYV